MEQYLYSVEELRASVEEGTRQVEQGQYYADAAAENYLYERAEKRFQEMKAGRHIGHEDSMAFIREYAQQNQAVAV